MTGTAAANLLLAAAFAYRVVGDAIPEPLAATHGEPQRGRALVVARDPANCVLCHAVPDPEVRFAGDLGPSLAGVGSRLSVAQLRLRIADSLALNPGTIMPSYYKVDDLDRVATAYRGKPILTAAEIEDVVAYLATLR
jgi:L-cysteine S-thiosulfotransferase